MGRGIFITGTDTGIGKTTVALGLMTALKEKGITVAAMKPVSAGCVKTEDGLRNEDAVRLMQQSSIDVPYEVVNPYAFEPPVAPHVAAEKTGISIDVGLIKERYEEIAQRADVIVVEGAGGWLVPINENKTMADVAKALSLDVLTVVGIRLGCLNHALLTVNNIETNRCHHLGWIANIVSDDMECFAENIQALCERIKVPMLDKIEYGQDTINLENTAKQLSELT